EALKTSTASIVGTIGASFAGLVVIFSVFFLGESISPIQILAIILIFIGVFLCTFNVRDISDRKLVFDRGLLLALVAMFAWGIYFTFIKIPVQHFGWYWPSMI